MRVSEIMVKNACYGGPGTNAAAAAEMMWANGCGVSLMKIARFLAS